MSESNGRINETMRMIRWRMANEKTSLGEVMRTIPRWLMGLVVVLFLAAQVIAQIVIAGVPEARPDFGLSPRLTALAMAGIVTGAGLVFASFVFLFAYINRDAKRRGMRYVLWTFIAILVPYLIGVIVYFLVREPLLYPCPHCGKTVSARFNFCPSCKFNLRPSCPQCKHEVRIGDHFCPNCACELTGKEAPVGG
jgi:hypothetical protein